LDRWTGNADMRGQVRVSRGVVIGAGREEGCAWPETQGVYAGVAGLVILMDLDVGTSPLSLRVSTAPNGLFNGLIWPKTSASASTALTQQRRHNFLPLTAEPPFLALQESFSCAVQPPQTGGAEAFVSGRSIAIEAAMVRARKRKTET
jgi:hypothetical protein